MASSSDTTNVSSSKVRGILDLPSTPFDELLDKIRPMLKNNNIIEHKQEILAQMCRYDSRSEDWCHYAHFDESAYTRNLVEDGGEHYNIITMCWRPGQSSPIHGHEGANCFIKILCGTLTEERHNYPHGKESSGDIKESFNRQILDTNNVHYIDDSQGVHKMINSGQRDAISLHIYVPPYKECRIFSLLDHTPILGQYAISDNYSLSNDHHRHNQSLTITEKTTTKSSCQPITSKVVPVTFYSEKTTTTKNENIK